ncbi:hypothetical protein J6590_024963 [Homalodisca vitripennis]|nr:hypothetical protein J6590_024963 [Homalodisca vitripennis]
MKFSDTIIVRSLWRSPVLFVNRRRERHILTREPTAPALGNVHLIQNTFRWSYIFQGRVSLPTGAKGNLVSNQVILFIEQYGGTAH